MNEQDHWGLRLRKARKNKNWSQDELAEAAGVSQATITKIERGGSEKSRFAPQLARALEVNVNWLVDGLDPRTPGHPWPDSDWTTESSHNLERDCTAVMPFPIPADAEAAGKALDQLPAMHYWHNDVLEAGGAAGYELAIALVRDSAMEPTIRLGEAVLLSVGGKHQLEEGHVYLVQWSDKPTLRRAIQRIGGEWSLIADNPDQRFQPQSVPENGQGLRVHGRVIWRGGWL